MNSMKHSGLILCVVLMLVACGRVNTKPKATAQSEEADSKMAVDQAMVQASKGGSTTLSAEEQMGILLNNAFPTANEVIILPPKHASSKRAATASGTTASGATWQRKNGTFVTPAGYTGLSNGVKYYDPSTGVAGSASSIRVPGVGAVGFAWGYNPQTGSYGIGVCYGSAFYQYAGCYGCSLEGCVQTSY